MMMLCRLWPWTTTKAEETTRVEQTNNSWHIDSCPDGFDNDQDHDNNTDNDDAIDLNEDWKDNFTVAWSL